MGSKTESIEFIGKRMDWVDDQLHAVSADLEARGSRIQSKPHADLLVRFLSLVPMIWYWMLNKEKRFVLAATASLATLHLFCALVSLLAARTFG